MPREARFQEPELPYHVTQRGNYRQDVFADEEDFQKYLELLEKYGRKYKLEVWAYCLMNNHVNLIVYPLTTTSMARTLATTHMVYAQHMHRRTGLVGHLWQGRFYSCALDDQHLYRAAQYVELNPVRAGLIKDATDWPWSSVHHHLGHASDPLLVNSRWPEKTDLDDWKAILDQPHDPEFWELLHRNTRTGRPLGSKEWVSDLEHRTGRRLHPLPEGRPRKK